MGCGSGFVGRARELELLDSQVSAACRGEGRIVLIGGEPGIGKTRLAEEASVRAAEAGLRCVRARASQDEGCPPYWLFRQVVRELVTVHEPGAAQRAGLAAVASEPRLDAARAGTSAEQRFALFESVREFLAEVAARTGLLVVLDDLQWADVPSLRLIGHLASGIAGSGLLLLATYRDTETTGRGELAALFAALAREDAVSRIRLTGLSQDEVACQLAAIAGTTVAPDVAAAVGRRTHGNPFFVAELGRLLDSAASGLPEAVRDAVRARLAPLTPDCRSVLVTTAALSSAIDPSAAAVVTQRQIGDVLRVLDEAAGAGIVTSEGGGWVFSHDLIREVAQLELPTADRLSAHARMASYLLGRADAAPALIAHHLLESLPVGDASQAAGWAQLAADDAMARLAWEDAASLYSRALAIAAGRSSAQRCRLLLGLGLAQLRSFDLTAATGTLLDAAAAARTAGDPGLMGEVALAMDGFMDPAWVATGKQLCDDALGLLPVTDGPLRSRLLARRAAEASYLGEPEAGPLSEQALAMAERMADPQALRSALQARQLARGGPDGAFDRLEIGAQMIAVGLADDDDSAELWGRLWRLDALAQLGRIKDADSELALLEPVVARMRSPAASWHLRRSQAALAFGRGQYARARQLTEESVRIALHGHENMRTMAATVLVRIDAITGRDEWVDTELDDFRWSPPFGMATRSWWHLHLGRREEARRFYRPDEGLARVPAIRSLPTYAIFAELAAAFDDKDTARHIYRTLLPNADLFVCGGAGLTVVEGSARRYLGIVAAALGHLDEAIRHLRAAVEANERAGLDAYVAFARFDLARVLARRRRAGERAEAAALAAVAAATAEQLGMARLRTDSASLAAELDGLAPGPLTLREREIAALVARGFTNRQIGAALHITERTAENHVQHILTKLGLHTRTQIAAWCASAPGQHG